MRPLTIGEVIAELKIQLSSHPGTSAVLLVELSDPFGMRESLGFEPAAALIDRFASAVDAIFLARAKVLRFGDAVCVFLPRVLNTGHAVLAAERIRRCVAESPEDISALERLLRIGVALHPRDGHEPQLLLRAAQLATAMARRQSQPLAVYVPNFGEEILAQNQVDTSLAKALEDGELTLHYQPKIHVTDGSVVGVEALMRWVDGPKAATGPDVFLPRGEEIGLSHKLAWLSLTNALRLSQSLGGLPVAVNITPAVLHQKEFVEMIESATRAWGARPGSLTLELTEGALVADFDEARSRLTQVRNLGVRVSIDDFGTGYSSFSYFKSIPADELKIDKSFILRMVEDAADQRLVAAIIALAHQFDLKVVAEGVETRACLEKLIALGCDCAQGFLFAAAMDEHRLRSWLWESRQEVAQLQGKGD